MGDEDLRELERRVRADSRPEERVRLALALERAGRSDDAYACLLPGVGDPEIRREISRYPAWTHAQANAGATGYADVLPVARPHVRWVAKHVADEDHRSAIMLASPLGIVARTRHRKDTKLLVLDAETGDRLWDAAWHAPVWGAWTDAAIRGDTLLARTGEKHLGAHDLRTGERLYRIGCDPDGLRLATLGMLIVARDGGLVTFNSENPREAPRARADLSFALPPDERPGPRRQPRFVTGAGLALATRRGTYAFERASGRAVWNRADAHFPMADSKDIVMHVADPAVSTTRRELTVVDPSGAVRWSAFAFPHALSPEFVIATERDGTPPSRLLVTLRRRDGDRREIATVPARARSVVIAARGVVYYWFEPETTISVISIDGTPLWYFPFRDLLDDQDRHAWVTNIAALPKRVYVRVGNGTIFCLDEATP